MTGRTERLMEALNRGDSTLMAVLGWQPVLEALRAWPKRLDGDELAPYVLVLGDQDPGQVAATIAGLAASSEYRPSASQVLIALKPPQRAQPRPGSPSSRRPDLQPQALQAVRLAAAAGQEVCDCVPSPQMLIDADGVLTCPDCQGLEPGQYDTAMEDL